MIRIASLLPVMLLLTICVTAQIALADGNTGPLLYKGKTFAVGIGEIEQPTAGKTTVEVLTDLVVQSPTSSSMGAMGEVSNAIQVRIIADGKTYDTNQFAIKDGELFSKGLVDGLYVYTVNHIVYHFAVGVKPEQIIIYNNAGSKIIFDGTTKRVIK